MTTLTNVDQSDASLKTAEGYSKSADLLMKYIGQTRSADVLASMIVLRSLAVEIYLKHLYADEYHKPYDGHHLRQIFDALSEETRGKINEYYDRNLAKSGFIKQILAKHQEIKGGIPMLNLGHVLQQWSEGMTERQYLFEPKHNVVYLALGEIEKAILERLREVSPGARSDPGMEQKSA